MRIPRGTIDADADRVVRRLARAGHVAYLVGGCVRDLLLDRTPKDFDVATSATPNEIKSQFRNCRIIGRRFRLAHIFFGSKIIETSTFRANPRDGGDADEDDELLIRRDNVFGTDTEDARRRDFTINGLFYDVRAARVIDHVGGLDDLGAKLIRTIGDPEIRFREDPVRMLRAIKFAARLGFEIESRTYAALVAWREEIRKCSPPRVLEEVYRLLRGGAAARSMELLNETGVAAVLSPQLAALIDTGRGGRRGQQASASGAAGHPADTAPEPASHGSNGSNGSSGSNGSGDEADAPAPTPPAAGRGAGLVASDRDEARWRAIWEDAAPPPETSDLELSFVDGDVALRACRRTLWAVLAGLDRIAAEQAELSNSLILAALFYPFLRDALGEAGARAADVNAMFAELGQPLIEQLHVARRDAERARQIVLAQRRIGPARRRRGRPMTLARRDYFDDALVLYELTVRAVSRDAGERVAELTAELEEDLEYWHKIQREGGGGRAAAEADKPRRRRRGGRRRRRGRSRRDVAQAGDS